MTSLNRNHDERPAEMAQTSVHERNTPKRSHTHTHCPGQEYVKRERVGERGKKRETDKDRQTDKQTEDIFNFGMQ